MASVGTKMLCKILVVLTLIVLVTLGDGIYSVGHGGTCRKDRREVALNKDNVLRLKDFGRFRLYSPRDVSEERKDREASGQTFQNIMSSKPGTIFRTEIFSVLRGIPAKDPMVTIRKLRESFKAPLYPVHSDFAFGPEWRFAGLALDGEKNVF
jgi:hypothetical protein